MFTSSQQFVKRSSRKSGSLIMFPGREQQPPVGDSLVSVKELALHLGFSARTIRNYAHADLVPSLKIENGRSTHFRFRISEVEAALRARGMQ